MIRKQPYKIFYRQLDEKGNIIGEGVYHKEYKYWGAAFNVAKKRYGDSSKFDYEIATRYPWMDYSMEVYCGVCGRKHTVIQATAGWNYTARISISDHNTPGARTYDSWENVCPDCLKKVVDYIVSFKEVK